jgi:hypothetical protein
MMEGSMKTLSRSRYHALSWSFTRMRGDLRTSGAKRTRRARRAVVACASGAARHGNGFQGGFLLRTLRSIIAVIRTGVVPGDTDI